MVHASPHTEGQMGTSFYISARIIITGIGLFLRSSSGAAGADDDILGAGLGAANQGSHTTAKKYL